MGNTESERPADEAKDCASGADAYAQAAQVEVGLKDSTADAPPADTDAPPADAPTATSTEYFSCYNSERKFFAKVEEITVGGVKCRTFNDEHFARIRAHFGIPNDFAQSKDHFDFSNMIAAGGKGGDPMARTKDKKYFIKEVNRDDHNTLLEIAKGLSEHFIEKTKSSIIVPIFAHFTRTDKKSKKTFFAMTNCLADPGPYSKIYDLKGCADDKLLTENGKRVNVVHKRIWKLNLWCGCGGEDRTNYLRGKLEALHEPDLKLTKSQKDLLINAIKNDCNFMKKYGLMDYSLLVAVINHADGKDINAQTLTEVGAGTALVAPDGNGKQRITIVGIIDFLQQWGLGKQVAKGIKVLERNKATIPPPRYADRFMQHFERIILVVDGDDDLEKQILARTKTKLPHRCYPFLRR
eukprot:CAMPEP_0204823828 /NCGR_PEP_ID=MMETSP1346-20131115/1904_1 /ASSEMBLY_ACC=CAM_ASM_000771 /TAXON_ID=215587 /ORGANISM="Aplanochytrium stocchinoi, Strain GSBS06" /LENGTH=408 /DNA_ID=CAMNT_0051950647 /DNA_START=72 /DNA_END=1298 /DNA_ORIENTATION=-